MQNKHDYNRVTVGAGVLAVILFAACFFSPGQAFGNEGRIPFGHLPLSPYLRIELARQEQAQLKPRSPAAGSAPVRVLIRGASDSTETVVNLVEETGGTVRSIVGPVISASVPAAAVPALAAEPEIAYISHIKKHRPLLDLSVPAVRADRVHTSAIGDRLSRQYTGDGVVVGVADSGIDWRHPDFINEDGTSRILYLWDQTDEQGPPPDGFGFGTEYDQDDLNDALQGLGTVDQADTNGHGTHVDSTAAGNGRSEGGTPGVAPEADLIVVNITWDDDDLMAAGQYIFQKAGELGKPCVINLSLGTHKSPHDGTGVAADGMNALMGAGRIVVAAAGNEGSYPAAHVGYTAGAGDAGSRFTPFGFYPGETDGSVDIWYEPPGEIEFRVDVFDMDLNLLISSGWVEPGWSVQKTIKKGGDIYGTVTVDAEETANPFNGSRHVAVQLEGDMIAYGYLGYLLWSRGTGYFDAWIDLGGFESSDFGDDYSGDYEMSVGDPAVITDVIAVASYTTRNQWTDIDGDTHTYSDTVGDISPFSSRGPTRNEALTGVKPEIAAPGSMIAAALSGDAETDRFFVTSEGEHTVKAGTSMACPHVVGAVALMLQKDPDLTPAEVKTLLFDQAVVDQFVADSTLGETVPNHTWGYGKLDVLAIMHAMEASDPGVPTGTITMTATPGTLPAGPGYFCTVVSDIITDAAQQPVADGTTFDVTVSGASGKLKPHDDLFYSESIEATSENGRLAFYYKNVDVNSREVEITAASRVGLAEGTLKIPLIAGQGTGKGCFIATAAYGNPGASHLSVLRRFRDHYLCTSVSGRRLVEAYYRWSPPMAQVIEQNPSLRHLVRNLLAPVTVGISLLLP